MISFFSKFLGCQRKKILDEIAYSDFISKIDRREIEKTFARAFLTEDGRKAAAYLQYITFNRALPPDSSENNLFYIEGQRALVSNILKLIHNGKQ
ncbi:MAG: hypothetical protein AAF988_08055 [Pseudomonadota bacterium]